VEYLRGLGFFKTQGTVLLCQCDVSRCSCCLYVKESDTPVDWDLAAGSTFLNYTYPPLPHVKFQLLSVRMLGLLIVHGMQCPASSPSSKSINIPSNHYAFSSLTMLFADLKRHVTCNKFWSINN